MGKRKNKTDNQRPKIKNQKPKTKNRKPKPDRLKPVLLTPARILCATKTGAYGGRFAVRVAWRVQSNLRWRRLRPHPSVLPEARPAPLPPLQRPHRQLLPARCESGQDSSHHSNPGTTSDSASESACPASRPGNTNRRRAIPSSAASDSAAPTADRCDRSDRSSP